MDESDDARAVSEIVCRESERQSRVIDQMISMHSVLGNRYRKRHKYFTIILIVISVILATLAFGMSTTQYTLLGIQAQRTSWLGVLTLAIALLTVVGQIVDFQGKGQAHVDAARRLASLKSNYRNSAMAGLRVEVQEQLTRVYDVVMSGLPPIPDNQFNQLKAAHLKKVAISKYLSAHPGASVRQARHAIGKNNID